jgi:membrane protease YdiL (CAAX protease family)
MITKLRVFFAKMPDWLEVFIVLAICFGSSVYKSVRSFSSGEAFIKVEFTDERIIRTLLYELVLTAVCFAFLRLRNYKIGERLKFEPSLKGTLVALGLFVATYIIYAISISIIFALVGAQNIPVAEYVITVGLPLVIAASLINPLFEETFVMGYVFDKFQSQGVVWAVTASVLIRVSYHLYQGWVGIISLLITGLIFAVVYARYRNLWPFYLAHALMDFVGLVSI